MADLRISELPPISGPDIQPSTDAIAVADISGSETKKATATGIVQAALGKTVDKGGLSEGVILPNKIKWDSLPAGSINGEGITINTLPGDRLTDGSVTSGKVGELTSVNLADSAVTTPKIALGAVATEKLADGAVTSLKLGTDAAIGNITDGSLNGGKLTNGTVNGGQKLTAGSVTAAVMGGSSVGTASLQAFAVTEGKLADDSVVLRTLNPSVIDPGGGLKLAIDGIAIDNAIVAGAYAGIAYNEQGLITAIDPSGVIPSTDLPPATATTIGAVSVPTTGGLAVSGTGELTIDNTVTATSYAGLVYNSHGLITGSSANGLVPSASLPIAGTTASEIGAVYVPGTGNLRVAADGKLSHATVAIAGTYTKVQVDPSGHVVDGGSLDAADIPNISADKITSGTIDPNIIPLKSVTREMLADYSISYIQEAEPSPIDPGHIGVLWYQESTGQLRMFNGNSFMPVGFGRLSQDNLRWGGIVDASTGLITNLTSTGQTAGLEVGAPIPEATDPLGGLYMLCSPGGDSIGVIPGVSCDEGDWVLCINEAEGWVHIDTVGGGGGDGGGATTLAALLDTTITTPEAGQLLQYNGAGMWVNAEVSTDKALDDLTDVDTSGVSDGKVLAYDSGTWVPVTAASLSVDVDLGYSAAPDKGTVTNSAGNNAEIPLGNGTNAGLSLNDYTTTEKDKLAGITPGADVTPDLSGYLQSGDKVSELDNDAGYLAAGDNVSELTNDAGYITSADIPSVTGFVKLDDEGTEQEITGGGGLSVEGGITSEFGTSAAQLGNIAPLNDWSCYPARA